MSTIKENAHTRNDIKLREAVVEASVANDFERARREWDVVRCFDLHDGLLVSTDTGRPITSLDCVCGKRGLRYVFLLRNRRNPDSWLWPIGSDCVKRFGVKDMVQQAKDLDRIRRVKAAVSALGPDRKVPLRRGEEDWSRGVLTPSAIEALWTNRLLDPLDDLDASLDRCEALDTLLECVGRKQPDPKTLELGHLLMETRVRQRIQCWKPEA